MNHSVSEEQTICYHLIPSISNGVALLAKLILFSIQNGNATVAWFWLIVASSGSQIAVSLLKMGQS